MVLRDFSSTKWYKRPKPNKQPRSKTEIDLSKKRLEARCQRTRMKQTLRGGQNFVDSLWHQNEEDIESDRDSIHPMLRKSACGKKCKSDYTGDDIEYVYVSSPPEDYGMRPQLYLPQHSEKLCGIPTIVLKSGQEIELASQLYSWIENGNVILCGNLWCPKCEYVYAGVSYTFPLDLIKSKPIKQKCIVPTTQTAFHEDDWLLVKTRYPRYKSSL
jgi:hypothetical protein